jgi:hypothetical protein
MPRKCDAAEIEEVTHVEQGILQRGLLESFDLPILMFLSPT